MKSLIIITALCGIVAVASAEQPRSRRTKSDLRIQRSKPSIFITFDHAGKREPLELGETDSGVWLRLHNNTTATIFLPSFSVPRALGQVGMFYDIVPIAQDDSYHDTSIPQQERIRRDVPTGYKLGHTSGAYLLQPGRSVIFSVPREHLPEGVALRINFNYEWELAGKMDFVRIGEPQHYVSFYSSELPEVIQKRVK